MKKLTLRNYFGYAAGDLANNLAFSLQALFLLIYYTNVVGLNPAAIATMFLVVRVWDAFADLAAGRLVDLTHSRWGKFRPYLLFASLPLLLSSIALFSVPNFDSTTANGLGFFEYDYNDKSPYEYRTTARYQSGLSKTTTWQKVNLDELVVPIN